MKRDFKGVWIPKEIWLNEDLSIIEKCLLVEIDSLDQGEGCFAGNDFLAEFIGKSEGRCANIISDLRKRGFIETVKSDGRKRWIRSKAGFTKTLKQTPHFREHSNTVSIIENNIKESQGSALLAIALDPSIKKTIQESFALQVIEAFKKVTGKSAKLTDQRKAMINARVKNGNGIVQFKAVFTHKFKEWKDDDAMKKYIRLETLLAPSHFQNYLEEAREAFKPPLPPKKYIGAKNDYS